jgi:hypothetical protein
MAGFTGLLEVATMGIGMAIGAVAKRYARVEGLAVPSWGMTLRTAHLSVQTRERVTGLGVIEAADANGLPLAVVVALQAVGTESSAVGVLMTARAGGRKAEERLIQILQFDGRAPGRGDTLCIMTPVAREACVLAFQCVPCQLVVKTSRIKLQWNEVLPVVVGVARDAFLTRPGFDVESGMQAFAGSNTGTDFSVAFDTTKGWLPGRELMAGGTVGSSVQGLMNPGKNSGGDLSADRDGGPQHTDNYPPRNPAHDPW